MGQKIHPIGFRVGITKKYQCQWFARFHKYNYAQSILEDRMLRTTLMKIFPELLNPLGKKAQKQDSTSGDRDNKLAPKITQIKIERGLIPYEIGIQIYTENAELIKSAIDNLKINTDLFCYLQKTRQYLLKLKQQINLSDLSKQKQVVAESPSSGTLRVEEIQSSSKNKGHKTSYKNQHNIMTFSGRDSKGAQSQYKPRIKKEVSNKPRGFKKFFPRAKESSTAQKLAKQLYKKKRLIQRRLKKRQIVAARYGRFISKGLFVKKIGNSIMRHLMPRKTKQKPAKRAGLTSLTVASTQKVRLALNKSFGIKGATQLVGAPTKQHIKGGLKISYAGIKKKFLSVFINKANKSFLKHLKTIMIYWHNDLNPSISSGDDLSLSVAKQPTIRFAPLGYGQHWSSSRVKQLQHQPISKLTRLVEILEQKSLIAMGKLRKHYLAFGVLSKTQGLGYYQIITFLKSVKKLVSKLRQQINVKDKKRVASMNSSLTENKHNPNKKQAQSKTDYWATNTTAPESRNKQKEVTEKVLRKTLNNVENQCRKIKFISYLKNMVKKHREQNIFYYLRTVADARKDLKQYKKFTKTHAKFLFGVDLSKKTSEQLSDSNELPEKIKERVTRVLTQSNKNVEAEKTLQTSFLNQIEKQKSMSLSNINLMPKISIKFYSIKIAKSFECKASIVADSIIDALEKRKAFRKVIKDAKENLMRTTKVKGVKIQVAGRLNGAEIARTEWVRAGRVPLQTLRANIDYISCPAHTIYGIIGIKVWIFKGYSKIN